MTDQHSFPITPVDQFRDAIARKGMVPPDAIIDDGKIHHFSSSGRPRDDKGWYVFHAGDIPTGAFGDFRQYGTTSFPWIADIGRTWTPTEKSDYQKKQADMRSQRKAETEQRRAEAKEKAATILQISSPARDGHPYLQRKGVGAYGLRHWKDLLVIPLYDDTGEVQSLQLISGDGGKKFLSGGKMQGCYFPIGNIDGSDTILIAEGYATAATIHELTGLPVIVAYNAGNLLPVAESIRAQYPSASIILCADDDFKTKGNPGITKATEAAEAIGGKVIVPVFGENRPEKATDFNDMAAHLGKVAVTNFFIDTVNLWKGAIA
ncbi:MAG: toprim domain-containing protein [Alphaproteobacteria bacterium]